MRLNIGCGPHYAEGWTNTDVVRNEEHGITPDIIAPASNLPMEDSSVTAVYVGHMLEHVAWESVAEVLAEMIRVMEPGAPLMVVGPDTRLALQMWRAGQLSDSDLDAILENEASYQGAGCWDGARHQWNCHSARVVLALSCAGFTDVTPLPIASPELDTWPVVSRIGWQCAVRALAP